jgi:hypothetical protein
MSPWAKLNPQRIHLTYPANLPGPVLGKDVSVTDADGVPFTNIFEVELFASRLGVTAAVYTARDMTEMGLPVGALTAHPLEPVEQDGSVLLSIGGGEPLFGWIVARRVERYNGKE